MSISRFWLYFFPYWVTKTHFKPNLITLSWDEKSKSVHTAITKSQSLLWLQSVTHKSAKRSDKCYHDIPYHAMHLQSYTPCPVSDTNKTETIVEITSVESNPKPLELTKKFEMLPMELYWALLWKAIVVTMRYAKDCGEITYLLTHIFNIFQVPISL